MATEELSTGELERHAARMNEIKSGAFGDVDCALIDAMKDALRVLIMTATLALKTQEADARHGRDIGYLKGASAPGRLIVLESKVTKLETKVEENSRWLSSQSDNHTALAGDAHDGIDDAKRRIDAIERVIKTQVEALDPGSSTQDTGSSDTLGGWLWARNVARRSAARHADHVNAPSYMKHAKSPEWNPHAWVVDAVIDAYATACAVMSSERDTAQSKLANAMESAETANRQRAATYAELVNVRGELASATDRIKELEGREADLGQLRKDFDARIDSQVSRLRGQLAEAREQSAGRAERIVTLGKQLADSTAHGLRLEQMHRDALARTEYATDQMKKFSDACSDQMLQIMELRKEIQLLKQDGNHDGS